MINNAFGLNAPPLDEFIRVVLPRHRDFFLKENESASELDFLESLYEIYSVDLSDYVRINGKDCFDDEVYRNRRIIEYLRQQIEELTNNRLGVNCKKPVKQFNNPLNVDLNKAVLTLEEAAAFVGLSKSTLYKLTSRGAIEFSKPNGKTIYIRKAYLEEWMMSSKPNNRVEIERKALAHCVLKNKRGGNNGK